MNASVNSPRQRWLDRYAVIQSLQLSIMQAFQDNDEDAGEASIERLNELILKQDLEIRSLPFTELSTEDADSLSNEIQKLQYNHQLLRKITAEKRQALLDQSSRSKKANRSIKAYQQAQNY
ncbi:MAG: hypothetical protein V7731_13555 [Amphritea sp.]